MTVKGVVSHRHSCSTCSVEPSMETSGRNRLACPPHDCGHVFSISLLCHLSVPFSVLQSLLGSLSFGPFVLKTEKTMEILGAPMREIWNFSDQKKKKKREYHLQTTQTANSKLCFGTAFCSMTWGPFLTYSLVAPSPLVFLFEVTIQVWGWPCSITLGNEAGE